MVRMLNIVGIAAWIGAGAILILCLQEKPWQASLPDEISEDSVVEKFIASRSSHPQDPQEQIAALVQEAQHFADYLNPPQPKEALAAAPGDARRAVSKATEIKPANTSLKFELHGISYHRSKPSRSMALVWDAANGHRWVKQGAQIGHVVIEEIHSSAISYSDGRGVHEMAFNTLSEATTMVAGTARSEVVPSRPRKQGPVVQRWAPVRGIRQMPAERVAAKLGLISRDTDTDM